MINGKELIQFVLWSPLIVAMMFAFLWFGLNAIEKESEWRNERILKFYSDEVKASNFDKWGRK
ncbi:MAG: hypothetical protein CMP22_07680 [Rickettsiales bacterium]|nr:hypothetical protein [Rickettsiales bacterium]|tara:strand:- start:1621 stop:1809 length:189 start_codon:yes stop_codon:yes gene_type:complete